MVSYFAQAAFKELAAAMFLLAFVIALPGSRRSRPSDGCGLPSPIVLRSGSSSPQLPRLARPAAALLAWLLADPISGRG